jgi:ribosomal subunit interface protein
MEMQFRIQNTDLSEALKGYIERRLRFALGRFGDRVAQVSVYISGNASSENECRISTELRPFGRVAVQETDSDLFAAIDRCTGRVGRLFGRELQRAREARIGHESVRMFAA